MSAPEGLSSDGAGAGHGPVSLQRLLEIYAAWNGRDVFEQAARRAAQDGDHERAAALRAINDQHISDDHGPDGSATPSALEALRAQHELASLLEGWRWQTVAAARDAGATWSEIGQVTRRDPEQARQDYLGRVEQQSRYGLGSEPELARYRAAGAADHRDRLDTDLADQEVATDAAGSRPDTDSTGGHGTGDGAEGWAEPTGDRHVPDPGHGAESEPRSVGERDLVSDVPPVETSDGGAEDALAAAQRQRVAIVQQRGFALTGPGHGAPQPQRTTSQDRLRAALTQYSKPTATIDPRTHVERRDTVGRGEQDERVAGADTGGRADARLAGQMQRTAPTEFGPADVGWVEAATEDELHAAGDDADHRWNQHGQTDDRDLAQMQAIDDELDRRATGDAVEGLSWRLGVRHAADRAELGEQQEQARRAQLNDWHRADSRGDDAATDAAADEGGEAVGDAEHTGGRPRVAGAEGWSR